MSLVPLGEELNQDNAFAILRCRVVGPACVACKKVQKEPFPQAAYLDRGVKAA